MAPPAGLVVACALAGFALLVLPDLFGLDRFTPFAQLVSSRPYLLAGAAALALVLAGLAFRHRRLRLLVFGLTAVVVTGAVLVLPRTIPTPTPDPAGSGGRVLTVIAFNTLSGGADVDAVAALIRTEHPDLVALVEAGPAYRSRLAPLVEPLGYRLHTVAGEPEGDLGGVTVASPTCWGTSASAPTPPHRSRPWSCPAGTSARCGSLRSTPWPDAVATCRNGGPTSPGSPAGAPGKNR